MKHETGGNKMSNPIKPNTKIRILSPEHREHVKKLALDAGFSFSDGEQYKDFIDNPFWFFTVDMKITWDFETGFQEVAGIKEIFIDLPEAKPTFPSFKVRGADDMAVREWLAENVTEKLGTEGSSILSKCLDMPYLYYCQEEGVFRVGDAEHGFIDKSLPELILEREITGYTLSPDPKHDELRKKLRRLEEELAEVKRELGE